MPDETPTSPPLVDDHGTPFDPSRHLPKKAKHGHWMPRSPGRGKKLPAGGGKTAAVPEPGSVEPLGTSAASSPVSPAAAPETSPAPHPARPAVPSFDDLAPLTETAADPRADSGEGRSKPEGDKSRTDADIVCRVTQLGTGLLLDPDEARPAKSDHENLVEATASVFRAKGWELPAFLAALALGAIYFLSVLSKPKSREKFNRWLNSRSSPPAPKKAEPAAPANTTAASSDSVPLPPGIPPLARP